jgi:hypothetical protein
VTELFIGEVDPSERGAIHAGKDVMRGPKFEPNETLLYSCEVYDIMMAANDYHSLFDHQLVIATLVPPVYFSLLA